MIKGLEKDRINMEERIMEELWEDTKIEKVVKGRKKKS